VTDPGTIDDAIARMESLCAASPKGDGVACFARLYLDVTKGVGSSVPTFADPGFLTRLDVVFAGLFFDALSAYEHAPSSAPRAWARLFEARSRPGIDPLQFALAGMNAHINRDLPVALVTTAREVGIDLHDDSPEHADYLAVNALLAASERRIKNELLTGAVGWLDRIAHRLGRMDDVVAMWDVERARDAAWVNGLALWALRDDGDLAGDFVAALDRTVGFAGRGLLRPAPGVLTTAWRRLRGLV
jgi:hypothetical protein